TRLEGPQLHYAETVRDSAAALLDLINDILDLSKMEAGRLELETGDFELRPLVAGVVDLLTPRIAGRDLHLSCHVASEALGVLRGDPSRLRQILLNLVGNALKFTERGNVAIAVSATEAGGAVRVRFTVADTGIGIPV